MIMRCISIVLFLVATVHLAQAEGVGSVGAVNQSAKGAVHAAKMHVLSIGETVENKERIETNSLGTAQIIFKDSSTMTVGKNSSITIDEFIYNPQSNVSQQGIALSKGALRFVGGQVSHDHGATIRTPAASIGIRGGIALIKLDTPNGALVLLQYGTLTVSSSENTTTVSRPGFAVYVSDAGLISEPFKAPADIASPLIQQFASNSDQKGGLKGAQPMNTDVVDALNSSPPSSIIEGAGLAELNQFWAGNSIVQSGANAANQAAATSQYKENQLILEQVIQLDKKGEPMHNNCVTAGMNVPC
jgi:hypothetical protein